MQNNKLIIGMPAGSLANSKRGGNLIELLNNAGFKSIGYETGGPTEFKTMGYLFGWDGRPQEFGSQLGINELDVAIAGDDWIKERVLELKLEYDTEIKVEKVLSLNRGGVSIVGINNDPEKRNVLDFFRYLCSEKKIITVVTEMPYLALNWVQQKLIKIEKADEYKAFSVQKYKTPPKIKKGIVIYEAWGKTEAKIKNGGADLGVEITQSGSAIHNYGLNILDKIFCSETGIYINPEIKNHPEKKELLKMFLLNLFGSVFAEHKVMIIFNVANNYTHIIENYLKDNNLFADEPTINVGKTYTEFSIQVDTTDKELPLAKIRFELAKRNAVNINTIPIDSSIPSIEVLGF